MGDEGTTLSQSLACGNPQERARAREWVVGAVERRRWYEASSMAYERFLAQRDVHFFQTGPVGTSCSGCEGCNGSIDVVGWTGKEPEYDLHKRLGAVTGGNESGRGMQHSTADVEAPTAARERCLQPRPVGHGYTSYGFYGLPHGKVQFFSSLSEMGKRTGTKDIGDLWESQARAEKSCF